MSDRYLTVAETADRLGISHDTVLRLIHARKLPALQVSERIYRVPRPALERFESGEPVMRRRVRRRHAATGVEFGAAESSSPRSARV